MRQWKDATWCIVGDMNAVRSNLERNMSDGDERNMQFINDFISDLELVDLPLNGRAFTWSDKHRSPLLYRLDRCLFDHAFDVNFSRATQTALVRTRSDHNALLIKLNPDVMFRSSFKIEYFWMKHKYFVRNIEIWWRKM